MKKRVVRLVVYFTLLAVALLVISHPYIRQSVFGPKIKGEPIWAWQEEVRARAGIDPARGSWWTKAFNLLGIDRKPVQWIGHFDPADPEMLPVLLSLVNDPDEGVRSTVAWYLGRPTHPNSEAAEALARMLDDPSIFVRQASIFSIEKYANKPSCRAKIDERLSDTDDLVRFTAARVILDSGVDTKDATELLVNGMQSSNAGVRQKAAGAVMRCNRSTGHPIFFPLLVEIARSDTSALIRQYAVISLRKFDKKGVPPLMQSSQDSDPTCAYWAIQSLGDIGPDAEEALPLLQKLADHPDPRIQDAARGSVTKIDPQRAKK